MRKAALGVLLLLAFPPCAGLVPAPAAAQTCDIRYDHYVYAAGGSGSPIAASGVLYSTPSLYQNIVFDGPAGDNWAQVHYFADIARGALGAYTRAMGDVVDTSPYVLTATGRVNRIQFDIDLYFDVPAGTYVDPVGVSVTGVVEGTLSSTLDAGVKVHYLVTFGETYSPPTKEIGIDESGTMPFSEPFTLDAVIVSAGRVLTAPTRFTKRLTARIEDDWAWAVLGGTHPNYTTGSASGDMYDGLRFTGVIVPDGVTWTSVDGVFMSTTAGAGSPQGRGRVTLHPNHPNPFGSSTTIGFDMPRAAVVRLCVHDLAGRRVRTLLDGESPSGSNAVRWDGRDDAGRPMPGGVYIGRLEADGGSLARRIVLAR